MKKRITAKFKSDEEADFSKIIQLLKSEYRVLATSRPIFDHRPHEFHIFLNLEEKQ